MVSGKEVCNPQDYRGAVFEFSGEGGSYIVYGQGETKYVV